MELSRLAWALVPMLISGSCVAEQVCNMQLDSYSHQSQGLVLNFHNGGQAIVDIQRPIYRKVLTVAERTVNTNTPLNVHYHDGMQACDARHQDLIAIYPSS